MEITTSKIFTTIITREVSTDDIEEILIKSLNLSKDAEFTWNIGQWVSLTIKETITTTNKS